MSKQIDEMFKVGAHYGYSKSRRHPTTTPYIFGTKNGVEIFDLEKTDELLSRAKDFAKKIASEGKQILFIAGKKQALRFLRDAADKANQPYVVGRWIGGTITNFEEIQNRVARFEKLTEEKEKGLLGKYTKKERLLIDREISRLEERFGGITTMKKKPAVFFIIDASQEANALAEAKKEGIPVISLCSSDCNLKPIDYPIVANDTSIESISYFINEITESVLEGTKNKEVVNKEKKD